MSAGDLYSQRQGRGRTLGSADFAELIWRRLRDLRLQGYFDEAVGPSQDYDQAPEGKLTEDDFLRALRVNDVYRAVVRAGRPDEYYGGAPSSCRLYPDVLFDTLELLYAQAVSKPYGDGRFGKEDGQQILRGTVNPDLALFDPPMELASNGEIVESAPDELRPLLDEQVPPDVPLPLRDPVEAAIAQFRRRGATEQDKRSALKHLADVLEPLRDEIDEHLLPADEAALFQLANGFYVRHLNRTQLRNYDGTIWLDWMFYVYVATARALLAVLDRQTLSESVLGPEPDSGGGLPI